MLEGDPNGLWWDEGTGILYIADDNGNRLLRWQAGRFLAPIALPGAPGESGPGLGQVVARADGTLLVTRFGFGTAGDIVQVSPEGEASVVPGLDPTRRRIGLDEAEDGTLVVAWFIGGRDDRVGGVSALALDGSGERDLVTAGLDKPVGVLARGGRLIIADQAASRIFTTDRVNPGALEALAAPPSADLLAAGEGGVLFTGGRTGEVFRISPQGGVEVVAAGLQEVRGLAWDRAGQRLFVAEHDPDEGDGVEHRLHILPLSAPVAP